MRLYLSVSNSSFCAIPGEMKGDLFLIQISTGSTRQPIEYLDAKLLFRQGYLTYNSHSWERETIFLSLPDKRFIRCLFFFFISCTELISSYQFLTYN